MSSSSSDCVLFNSWSRLISSALFVPFSFTTHQQTQRTLKRFSFSCINKSFCLISLAISLSMHREYATYA